MKNQKNILLVLISVFACCLQVDASVSESRSWVNIFMHNSSAKYLFEQNLADEYVSIFSDIYGLVVSAPLEYRKKIVKDLYSILAHSDSVSSAIDSAKSSVQIPERYKNFILWLLDKLIYVKIEQARKIVEILKLELGE